jgi:ATP-dependent helicase HepA
LSEFAIGQRFVSEAEPELGLGTINHVESKMVKILFSGSHTERTYGTRGAPLRRVIFSVGDEITWLDGTKIIIETVEQISGVYFYNQISEVELSPVISLNRPEEKIFAGKIDSVNLFSLRQKTLKFKNQMAKSSVKGFIGGRMDLLPHQFYVSTTIAKRPIPRVLLADEVGLGKTVEAGLIIHHLLLTERVKRVLILVPDSLVYQWFVEMLRKFNLSFTTLNQETYLEPETNPFFDNDLVILNIGLLKGAEMARAMMDKVEWDLLVVDEAHQLKWSIDHPSIEYKIVEKISDKSKGLLLLTATPEQLGLEGHFARLKLIDPNRFYNYHKFLEEVSQYESVASHARSLVKNNLHGVNDQKIKELLDQHGTGRIFFRNTRQRMALEFSFFPKRILHAYPLESKKTHFLSLEDEETIGPSFDLKLDWLSTFLESKKGEKILLITKSKMKVICLEKVLKERMPSLKVSVFHSGLSFIARDRQAAYFAEPTGADVLLCTEVGSEGRNFEFAHHLVLFDLPSNPDLLEQRIGRLDRIGQNSDINLHVPYIMSSYDEILFHWYNEGMEAFTHSAKGASLVHQRLETFLMEYLNHPQKCLENPDVLHDFIATTKKEYLDISHHLEEGRDVLVELNSFNDIEAHKIVNQIKVYDEASDLMFFMNEIFSELGVDIEDLNDTVFFIKPSDNMYVPHFPGLSIEGLRITYDRTTARKRDDVEFLTWDHPLVTGAVDLILSNSIGNTSVMMRRKTAAPVKTFLECFYTAQLIAPKEFSPERFFPLASIRILVDSSCEDFTAKWGHEEINEKITLASPEIIHKAKTIPKVALQKILLRTHELAKEKSSTLIQQSKIEMQNFLGDEKVRLIELMKINPSVRQVEIDSFDLQINTLNECFQKIDVTLDSIRLIF